MRKLLSACLSVVILSLAGWAPAAAQTGVEYGQVVSQPKAGKPVNTFAGNTKKTPKKHKVKR